MPADAAAEPRYELDLAIVMDFHKARYDSQPPRSEARIHAAKIWRHAYFQAIASGLIEPYTYNEPAYIQAATPAPLEAKQS
jgi:hypothetical protein